MNMEELLERGLDPTVPFETARKVREDYLVRQHYIQFEKVKSYRNIAQSRGFGADTPITIEQIRAELCSPLGIYKPELELILNQDYEGLTKWLSLRYYDPSLVRSTDISKVKSLDSWLKALEKAGAYVTHSSGTSGRFSYVPWDKISRNMFKQGMRNVFKELGLLDDGTGSDKGFRRFHSVGLVPISGWGAFASMNELLYEYQDEGKIGVFYAGMRTEMSADLMMAIRMYVQGKKHGSRWMMYKAKQSVEGGKDISKLKEEISKLMSEMKAIEDPKEYNKKIVELSRLGEDLDKRLENQPMQKFSTKMLDVLEDLLDNKAEISVRWSLKEKLLYGFKNFHFTMREEDFGIPIAIGGTPWQMSDLIDLGRAQGRSMRLPPDSFVLISGGWKHRHGDRLEEEVLVKKVHDFFGEHVPVFDTYGMTEGGLTSMKMCKGSKSDYYGCSHYNFHVPHSLDVFVFTQDEYGNTIVSQESGSRGHIGYILPIHSRISAISSDDIVTLRRGCPCGFEGFVIEKEVERDVTVSIEGCGVTGGT